MKRIVFAIIALLVVGAAAFGALVWMLSQPPAPLAAAPANVTIAQGELRGGVDGDNPGVLQFNGIPYAAPPTGDLRWTAPVQPATWSGVRDARDFGAECLQARSGSAGFQADIVRGMGLNWAMRQLAALSVAVAPAPVESEDCLYLNVRTANVGGDELQPVMVWIHGGSHQNGSGSMAIYQSNGLVENGVVLITINYRLGPLGYLAHPALSADDPRGVSGNYGLMDQIAALEWVQANIAEFGGDPDNVTVFGESAGAQAVSEIMAAPSGNGLYHKAILQSGASSYNMIGLDSAVNGRLSAHEAGELFFEGLAPEGASAVDLRAIDGGLLIARAEGDRELTKNFLPNVDGEVVPQLIGQAIISGDIQNVPVLAGYNGDEASLFYGDIGSPTLLHSPFPDEHEARMALIDDLYGAEDGAALRAEYELDVPENWLAGATDMLGDDLFGVHVRLLGRENARQGQPTWLYHFTRVPPYDNQTIGAFHASELFFVFDSHVPFLKVTDADRQLTETMGQYWTNFARTGDPNGADLPVWPAYGARGEWNVFAPEISVQPDVRSVRLDPMERTLRVRLDRAAGIINPPTYTASNDQQISADPLQP